MEKQAFVLKLSRFEGHYKLGAKLIKRCFFFKYTDYAHLPLQKYFQVWVGFVGVFTVE